MSKSFDVSIFATKSDPVLIYTIKSTEDAILSIPPLAVNEAEDDKLAAPNCPVPPTATIFAEAASEDAPCFTLPADADIVADP